MLIGYARTSTEDQEAGLEAQIRDLKEAGCGKIFSEQVSSVDIAGRTELAAALVYCREGDTLVCTKIDRLARSVKHLLELVEQVSARGVNLRIMNMGADFGGPMGRLMLTVTGAFAEFERAIMLDRQREGISKAKSEGKYLGRKPTARAKAAEIKALAAAGLELKQIADRLNIGRVSVWRVLKDTPEAAAAMQKKVKVWTKREKRSGAAIV